MITLVFSIELENLKALCILILAKHDKLGITAARLHGESETYTEVKQQTWLHTKQQSWESNPGVSDALAQFHSSPSWLSTQGNAPQPHRAL